MSRASSSSRSPSASRLGSVVRWASRLPGGRAVLELADRVALAYLEQRYVILGRGREGSRRGESARTN